GYGAPRATVSFPTRRSSDLGLQIRIKRVDENAEFLVIDLDVPGQIERDHRNADGRSEIPDQAEQAGGIGAESNLECGKGNSRQRDRKSTRLNSSHVKISYAV